MADNNNTNNNVFQALTAHGNPGAAPAARKKHLVEFRAGKMTRDGRLVRPDTRKGTVYLEIGADDGLLHFCWAERTTIANPGRQAEEDLIVFPEEAEWIKVEQSNDRVYMLAFKSSSQKLFFWMQEPKDDKDAQIAATINLAINDPAAVQAQMQPTSPTSPVSPSAAAQQAQIQQLLAQMATGTAMRPQSPTRAASPTARAASPSRAAAAAAAPVTQPQPEALNLAAIRSLMSGIQVPTTEPDVDLTSVLTADTLRPVLSDPAACAALFPHLPADAPHTPAEIEAVVRSPQFRASLGTLAYALRSGQLATVLASVGVRPEDAAAHGGVAGVEALLRAVAASASKKKTQGGAGSPGPASMDDEDRMDTS
ncbi:proteasome complex subunit Rpn13 ubiquitin receptor-domain-containing protein [Blastocladiella britannica]|nr:proteasome complex subunit Rpn13 ubiquitin receptor-domain-containing protein [Blastocladiella britannica]